MSVDMDARILESVYNELTDLITTGTYKRKEITSILERAKGDDMDIYTKFLSKCRQNRYMAAADNEYLKKVDHLEACNLPFASQLTNFESRYSNLETNRDIDKEGSVFTNISLAIFGTTEYSQCLRVVLVRHLVQNWTNLKKSCQKIFNVSLKDTVQTTLTHGIQALEPTLLMFSYLLEGPIYLTTVENTAETKQYTYVFQADKQHSDKHLVWLTSLNGKLMVRLPKTTTGVTGVEPSMAINWGINVQIQDLCDQKSPLYVKVKRPMGLMVPVIRRPEFMNQELYNKARDLMELLNQADFNKREEKTKIDIGEINQVLLKNMFMIATNLIEEAKIRKEIQDTCVGGITWLWKNKCKTCASWYYELVKINRQIKKVASKYDKQRKVASNRKSRWACDGCLTCPLAFTCVQLLIEQTSSLIGMLFHFQLDH